MGAHSRPKSENKNPLAPFFPACLVCRKRNSSEFSSTKNTLPAEMNLPLFIRQNGICNVIIGGMQRVAKKKYSHAKGPPSISPQKKVLGSKFGKLFSPGKLGYRSVESELDHPPSTNKQPTFRLPTFDRFKSRGGGKKALIFEFWWENTSLLHFRKGQSDAFRGIERRGKNISTLAKILQSSA